jgi:inositol phosphorylceramide mannosyltransferase catalytic subunit
MSRVRIAVITVVLLASLGFIVYRIAGFASLFFEHSGIAITQDAILAAHSGKTPEARPQVIPKIIHHVFHDWHNESMPKDWDDVRQTCINLNPDWEYKVSRRVNIYVVSRG